MRVFVALALLAFTTPAYAYDEHATQYGVSSEPLWKVGTRDTALSLACRQGRFNEARINYYYITFTHPEFGGTTGIAKVGFNLIDKEGKGKTGETYYFYQDGTSECGVYIAKDR